MRSVVRNNFEDAPVTSGGGGMRDANAVAMLVASVPSDN
jgi:hypothetical protein